jgi:hypothetical protein
VELVVVKTSSSLVLYFEEYEMQTPNIKSLERVWKTSVLFTVILTGFVTFVGFSAIGGVTGFTSIAHNESVLILVMGGFIFCVLYFVLTWVSSSIFFYFGCKMAFPDIKPFVNGKIGPESALNSSTGHQFTTDYVPFYSKTLGRLVNVYFFKTGEKDVDHYLAKYVRARDTALIFLYQILLVIAALCFELVREVSK